MKLFLQHCADRVTDVPSGFDRLMLHGSLRLFASREKLLPLYERLIRHGMAGYGAGDVLRFFGRRQSPRIQPERLSQSRCALVFVQRGAARRDRTKTSVGRNFPPVRRAPRSKTDPESSPDVNSITYGSALSPRSKRSRKAVSTAGQSASGLCSKARQKRRTFSRRIASTR